MRFVILTAALIALSGCAGKARLPFGNVDKDAACPAQKEINCAPQISHNTKRLNLAPAVIRTKKTSNPSGETKVVPFYGDYIGTVFHRKDKLGSYPRFCATNNGESPFSAELDHFEFSSIDHQGSYSGKFGQALNVSAAADIAEIVRSQTGVLDSTQAADDIEAAVSAAINNTRNTTLSADFSMILVRLTEPTLNKLLWSDYSRFADCRALLRKNKNYQIVQSMTVFKISKQTLETIISRQLALDIVAGLNGTSSSAIVTANNATESTRVAGISAGVKRTVGENIDTELGDYYIISTLGLLQPSELTNGSRWRTGYDVVE